MPSDPADLDVLIVGAGPVGLLLANECARRGLSARIVETRAGQSEHSKALAIFPRTLEIFDMAGLVGPFRRRGECGHPGRRGLARPGARGGAVRPRGDAVPIHRDGPPGRHREAARGGAAAKRSLRRVSDDVRVGRAARRPCGRHARSRRPAQRSLRGLRGRMRRRAQRGPPPPESPVRGRPVRGPLPARRRRDERRPGLGRAAAVPERIRSPGDLPHERHAAARRGDLRPAGGRCAVARAGAEHPAPACARGDRGAVDDLVELLPDPPPSGRRAARRADVRRGRRRAHPQPLRRPGDEHGPGRRLEPRVEARSRAARPRRRTTSGCSTATPPSGGRSSRKSSRSPTG